MGSGLPLPLPQNRGVPVMQPIRTISRVGQFSPGEEMAPLAESMKWPRKLFSAPVLWTVAAPEAPAVWCCKASPLPVSSLQREEQSLGGLDNRATSLCWICRRCPCFQCAKHEDRQCPVQQVMPQSARRWNGLPPPRAVLFCSPGLLTTVRAATCGPMLAFPHNDGSMAATSVGPGATCPPLQDTRGVRSLCQHLPLVCQLVAAGLDSLSVVETPALFFLTNDRFLFPNDRSVFVQ